MDDPHHGDLTYARYLRLSAVLSAQRPRSDQPDERLFIVVHQIQELLFKQLLGDLAEVRSCLARADGVRVVVLLDRAATVLTIGAATFDLLDSMSPVQFDTFRPLLGTASGGQSEQFRRLETVLGVHHPDGAPNGNPNGHPDSNPNGHLNGKAPGRPDDELARARRLAGGAQQSVFEAYLDYLAHQGYAPRRPFPEREAAHPGAAPSIAPPLTPVGQALTRAFADGGEAALIGERLIGLDDAVQRWRYRHVRLVARFLGARPGTGGSSGATYLRDTVLLSCFPDLVPARLAAARGAAAEARDQAVHSQAVHAQVAGRGER